MRKNPEKISKIESFIVKYNWERINFEKVWEIEYRYHSLSFVC